MFLPERMKFSFEVDSADSIMEIFQQAVILFVEKKKKKN